MTTSSTPPAPNRRDRSNELSPERKTTSTSSILHAPIRKWLWLELWTNLTVQSCQNSLLPKPERTKARVHCTFRHWTNGESCGGGPVSFQCLKKFSPQAVLFSAGRADSVRIGCKIKQTRKYKSVGADLSQPRRPTSRTPESNRCGQPIPAAATPTLLGLHWQTARISGCAPSREIQPTQASSCCRLLAPSCITADVLFGFLNAAEPLLILMSFKRHCVEI